MKVWSSELRANDKKFARALVNDWCESDSRCVERNSKDKIVKRCKQLLEESKGKMNTCSSMELIWFLLLPENVWILHKYNNFRKTTAEKIIELIYKFEIGSESPVYEFFMEAEERFELLGLFD
jgi:hypothetical protein